MRAAIAIVITLVAISACSKNFDYKNVIEDYQFQSCVSHDSYTDDEYDELCYGKSVDVIAFVTDVDDDEVELSLNDGSVFSSAPTDTFFAQTKVDLRRTFKDKDKVRVRGVIDDRTTFLGKLDLSPSNLVKVELSEVERGRRSSKTDWEIQSEAANAYAAATDEANAAYEDWVAKKKKELESAANDVSITHLADMAIYSYDMKDGRIVTCRQYAGTVGIQFECEGE